MVASFGDDGKIGAPPHEGQAHSPEDQHASGTTLSPSSQQSAAQRRTYVDIIKASLKSPQEGYVVDGSEGAHRQLVEISPAARFDSPSEQVRKETWRILPAVKTIESASSECDTASDEIVGSSSSGRGAAIYGKGNSQIATPSQAVCEQLAASVIGACVHSAIRPSPIDTDDQDPSELEGDERRLAHFEVQCDSNDDGEVCASDACESDPNSVSLSLASTEVLPPASDPSEAELSTASPRRRRRRSHKSAASKALNGPTSGLHALANADSTRTAGSVVTWNDIGGDLLIGPPGQPTIVTACVRPKLERASRYSGECGAGVEVCASATEAFIPQAALAEQRRSSASAFQVDASGKPVGRDEPSVSDCEISAKSSSMDSASFPAPGAATEAASLEAAALIEEAALVETGDGERRRARRHRRRHKTSGTTAEDSLHHNCGTGVYSPDRSVVTWSDLDRSSQPPAQIESVTTPKRLQPPPGSFTPWPGQPASDLCHNGFRSQPRHPTSPTNSVGRAFGAWPGQNAGSTVSPLLRTTPAPISTMSATAAVASTDCVFGAWAEHCGTYRLPATPSSTTASDTSGQIAASGNALRSWLCVNGLNVPAASAEDLAERLRAAAPDAYED